MNPQTTRTALVIGASRSIGLALAADLLNRGWDVIATARSGEPEELRRLAAGPAGARLTLERIDITEPDQIEALRDRLSGTPLDLLFVNAGVADEDLPAETVPTDVFSEVMITNALSPMRVVTGLGPLVRAEGTIAVMSSRQGSVSFNTRGGHEVYRASKSALNQLMRSYAARPDRGSHTLLLLHPGWVQTDLGGPGAELTVEESSRGVIDVVEAQAGAGGLQFLDYRGQTVPW